MVATATASRMSISTVCLSGTLEDKIRAAAAAGFTGVELLEYDLVMSAWSPGRVAEEAAASGCRSTSTSPSTSSRCRPSASTASCGGPTASSTSSTNSVRACWCAARRRAPTASTTRRSPSSSCRAWPNVPRPGGCGSRSRRCPGAGSAPPRRPGDSSRGWTIRRSACASTASTCCRRRTTRVPSRGSTWRACSTCSSRMRRG